MAINDDDEEIRCAEARMNERMAGSRAVCAYYNERDGNIIVELSTTQSEQLMCGIIGVGVRTCISFGKRCVRS